MRLYLSAALTAAEAASAIGIDARAVERSAPSWFSWQVKHERRVAGLLARALGKARKEQADDERQRDSRDCDRVGDTDYAG